MGLFATQIQKFGRVLKQVYTETTKESLALSTRVVRYRDSNQGLCYLKQLAWKQSDTLQKKADLHSIR